MTRAAAPTRRLPVAAVGWSALFAACVGLSAVAFATLLRGDAVAALIHSGLFALEPKIVTGLASLGITPQAIAAADASFRVLGCVVFFVTAVVIYVRQPSERISAVVSAMLLLAGTSFFAPLRVLAEGHPGWRPIVAVVGVPDALTVEFGRSLAGLSILLFLLLFPDGRFSPSWTRRFAIAVAGWVLLWTLLPGSIFDVTTWPQALRLLWIIGIPVTALSAQLYRFAVLADAAERQKTKLVVGAIVALVVVPTLLLGVDPELGGSLEGLTIVTPRVAALYEIILLGLLGLAVLVLPLSLGVAVLRYRLWDADVFLNRALVYGALTGLVALVYLGGVVLLGGVFSRLFGALPGSNLAVLASTVGVALLFQPARVRLQEMVDRRFFRRKYDAMRTIERYSEHVRLHAEPETLAVELLALVKDTMQPRQVHLVLRTPSGAFAAPEGTPTA